MESVYLETTFISYLVARPSRDVIVAGHQQTTHDWWDTRRSDFACHVSQVVVDEVSAGDPDEIRKRLDVIRILPLLEVTESVQSLAQAIVASGVIPPRDSRCRTHCHGGSSPDGLSLDVELPPLGERPDHAENRARMRRIVASHAGDLYSRRTDGKLT